MYSFVSLTIALALMGAALALSDSVSLALGRITP